MAGYKVTYDQEFIKVQDPDKEWLYALVSIASGEIFLDGTWRTALEVQEWSENQSAALKDNLIDQKPKTLDGITLLALFKNYKAIIQLAEFILGGGITLG